MPASTAGLAWRRVPCQSASTALRTRRRPAGSLQAEHRFPL